MAKFAQVFQVDSPFGGANTFFHRLLLFVIGFLGLTLALLSKRGENKSMTGKAKILIAEDEPIMAKLLKDELEEAGFEIVIALDGVEALGKIQTDKPDLMILDLIMPLKNGFEVLEEMHKSQGLEMMPIIVLTNLGQDKEAERAISLGAKDFLIKANVNIKDVVAKVKKYVQDMRQT